MPEPPKLDYGKEERRELPAFVVALVFSVALLAIYLALPFVFRLLAPLRDPLLHWTVGDFRA